jgi:anti-anti-sigma factor
MATSPEKTFSLETRKSERAVIVDVLGPLYLGESSTKFAARIKELVSEGHRNIGVNFAAVPKIDSSGMGALVHAHTSVRNAGGKMKLFSVRPPVLMILKMVRLETVFDIVPDEAAAVSSFD